jgi:hypothetical protein
MFAVTPQYNRNNNNKHPHVASDSSSTYSSESEMSISSSHLAPSPSPDLFYIETDQLPLPMSLSTKTLQFGTTETIPTVLFKGKQLEDSEVSSQSEPLVPGLPLTSKAPAKVHIKVEHFEAVTNAHETEAKTDTTTNTSTTAATSTDSDKENKTPYAPSSVSPKPEYTNLDIGRSLCLLYNTLHTYYGPPRPQTSFEKYSGPTWTDDKEEEIEDNSDESWGKPNPVDKFEENANIHHGEGWYLNDPFTKYYYRVEIIHPITSQYINAPYVTFHIQLNSAQVSAIYGKGYAVVIKPLKPVSVCYTTPLLTPEQILLLDPAEGHAQAVQQVVEDQFPLHLSAALKCYHFYKCSQYQVQHHIHLLKEREYRYMEKALGILKQLENANVLG